MSGNFNGTWSSTQVNVLSYIIIWAKTPVPSEYLLHGQILESAGGSKYLGVKISGNLSFENHIQKICTSASRSLEFIKRNIRTKYPAIRKMAYKTLLRPLVDYSPSVWSPYTQSNINKIAMVHIGRLGGHLPAIPDMRV